MNVILGFIFILILGYIGSYLTEQSRRFSLGMQAILTMGAGFLILGMGVGPHGLDIITTQALSDLSPVISLGLGWMGLLIGMQFDWRVLRQISASLWQAGCFISISVILIVTCGMYGFGVWHSSFPAFPVGACICFGCIASVSDYSAVALIKNTDSARGGIIKTLQLLTDIRAPIAIILITVWYSYEAAWVHSGAFLGESGFSILQQTGVWMGISILMGVTLGWMLHYLTSERLQPNEMLLVLAGSAVFSAGLASSIHLSPLCINFVMGVTLTNLPNFARGRVSNRLLQTERPFFTVFMIIAGALWVPMTDLALLAAFFYIGLRFAALFLCIPAARWIFLKSTSLYSMPLRFTMLSQGAVSFALIVDFFLIQTQPTLAPSDEIEQSSRFAEIAFSMMLPAILINQLIGSNTLRYALRQAGAIRSKTPRTSVSSPGVK